MNKSQIISVFIAVLIGFAAGWLLKPSPVLLTPPLDLGSSLAYENEVPDKTNSVATAEIIDPEQEQTAVEQSPDTESAVATSLDQPLERAVLELDFSEWSIDDIVDYLSKANSEEFYSEGFLDIFAEDPELVSALLEKLFDIDNPVAMQRARELLSVANRRNNYDVERQIIERINLGERTSEWLSLLNDTGVFTTESLDFLGARLDTYLQGDEVIYALGAIDKGSNRFFNRIPRETRETITNKLSIHLESTDPRTKAAALASLAAFPVPGSDLILVEALADSDKTVQRGAIQALMRGEFQSDQVRNALVDMMRNQENDFDTRVMTTYALRRYNLEGQDYDDLYEFSQEIQKQRNGG